ncbi:class I SAM-dependent methyltransferase [Salinivibrio sp. ES.052]|uniref:class I SAM-dependent methyltransferase n=1 Tax=Salinivibrio sp. ES.052 TaxID=1882823 RepID=UPI00092B1C4E|nr:class I SAM-dependent methyltransferase [Salinivibrio sp. ES.052]SIO23972.1 Methyltransferase domain-containing protein [Salinivibrio sp. ES.052]
MQHCPLCEHTKTHPYHTDKRRAYHQCARCMLVFVDRHALLAAEDEKAIYDLHQNHPEDEGYQRFLSRLVTPLLARLPVPLTGLDFGCGPGPVLAQMLRDAGHSMACYDPFYAPETDVLDEAYDFITCTEAIEHFHRPGEQWAQWQWMLKPGGYLGIMTKLVRDPVAFSRWHYKNDLTHVSFFSGQTFQFLAEQAGFELTFLGNDVILMRKPLS